MASDRHHVVLICSFSLRIYHGFNHGVPTQQITIDRHTYGKWPHYSCVHQIVNHTVVRQTIPFTDKLMATANGIEVCRQIYNLRRWLENKWLHVRTIASVILLARTAAKLLKRLLLSVDVSVSATMMLNILETKPFRCSCPIGTPIGKCPMAHRLVTSSITSHSETRNQINYPRGPF